MTVRIIEGDVRDGLAQIPDQSIQCCVTSPPYYGLRDYGVPGQLGLEPKLAEYIATMVEVFRDVRRVLRDDGTLWLNIGDSYNGAGGTGGATPKQITNAGSFSGAAVRRETGLKPKDLMMVPARLAIALVDDGWYLRSDVIWHKPNPMPESVTDRPTSAHEHIFLLTKRARYYYDADAIREPLAASSMARLAQDVEAQEGSHRANGGAKTNGTMKAVRASGLTGGAYSPPGQSPHGNARGDKQRGHSRRHAGFNDRWDAMPLDEQQANGANARNVWTIATKTFSDAHFATFPPEIPRRCIKAGTSEKGQCPACGAPWVRVTERESAIPQRTGDWKLTGTTTRNDIERKGGFYDAQSVATGWQPSCVCDAGEPVPQTVLDPFLGSGTTLLVADRLGRDGIGVELNREYALMSQKRIQGDSPMFARVTIEGASLRESLDSPSTLPRNGIVGTGLLGSLDRDFVSSGGG